MILQFHSTLARLELRQNPALYTRNCHISIELLFTEVNPKVQIFSIIFVCIPDEMIVSSLFRKWQECCCSAGPSVQGPDIAQPTFLVRKSRPVILSTQVNLFLAPLSHPSPPNLFANEYTPLSLFPLPQQPSDF